MDNLIVAAVILLFVIIFTAVNAFIICGICDEIIALVDKGELNSALALWEDKRLYISLFVRDAEIDAADCAHFTAPNDETAASRFRESICEIRDTEHLCFSNVF